MTLSAIHADLVAAGFRPEMARAKATLLEEAVAAVGGEGNRYFIPGRIEVLGKHTDYCGGNSLVCATEQGLCVAAKPLDEPVLRIHALTLGRRADIPLTGTETDGREPWAVYAQAVARRLQCNFGGNLRGVEIAIKSDLPQAAGLSSSSAMIVACFIALADRNDLSSRPIYREHLATPEALAHYLGCIENGSSFGLLEGEAGVGTNGGSQDHTAILCAKPGRLSQVAFCPVRHLGDVALSEDLLFVIGVSGVVAEKTGAAQEAYNAVSQRARHILTHFNEVTGAHSATLAAAARQTPTGLWQLTPPALQPRLAQFLEESAELVPSAFAAIAEADYETFGQIVDRSQKGAERGLENQVPETIHLATSARQLDALASSAFGAGFGGSVWALVHADAADAFISHWSHEYATRFPRRQGTFLTTRPGPPAHKVG